LAKRVKYNLIF